MQPCINRDEFFLYVSGGGIGTVRRYCPATEKFSKPFNGHKGPVTELVLSNDPERGQRLYTAAWDYKVHEWDVCTREILRTFSLHTDIVKCMCISPCEKYIFTGGADSRIYKIDLDTFEAVQTYEGHHRYVTKVMCLELTSYNRTVLISVGSDNFLCVFDVDTGARLAYFRAHETSLYALAYREGELWTGSADKDFKSWSLDDLMTGEYLDSAPTPLEHQRFDFWVTAFGFTSSEVFVGLGNGEIHVYDLATMEKRRVLDYHIDFVSVIMPMGDKLLTSSYDYTIKRDYQIPRAPVEEDTEEESSYDFSASDNEDDDKIKQIQEARFRAMMSLKQE
ncbi:hypothetical protein PCE1_001826 [Barthelona sp. PCE]